VRKDADSQAGTIEADDGDVVDDDEVEETDVEVEDEDEPQAAEPEVGEPDVAVTEGGAPVTPVKKKTRRGSRGGKNRKKPAGAPAAAAKQADAPQAEAGESEPEPELPAPTPTSLGEKKATIHLPSDELGREDEVDEPGAAVETPSENGAPSVAKKKTRRGSRGGKNRRKRTAAAAAASNGAESAETPPVKPVEAVTVDEPATNGAPEEAPEDDWGYVPMSEWVDELDK
jgi:hypothetical protein